MDLLARTFGPGPGQIPGYCGHPELELALVKLYRATGERRYLELAQFFVDQRGQPPVYFQLEAQRRGDQARRAWGDLDVYQAHAPLRQQRTAEGHAVRAVYLYSGAADVAMETGDTELWATCRQLWENITQRRMSVHGGIGASRFHERFTLDYDLPNEEVYAETCAAIGLVFFSYRMLCGEPDARYADVMERALYNGIVSGVSLDGTKFFYDNYLASYPGIHALNHQKPPERVGWFGTACCPPNLARLTASLGSYLYGTSTDTLYVHHYVGSQWSCTVGGQTVLADMVTSYPWDGDIALTVRPPAAATFAVALRLPGWCRAPELSVNGRRQALEPLVQRGYAVLHRTWQPGDRIELRLPMPIERLYAHPKVRQDAGRVALQRGPLLYCLEQVDNGPDLNALVLPRQARLEAAFRPGLLGGVTVITGEARRDQTGDWGEALYRTQPPASAAVPFTAIPYYAWANRGPGELLVWLRDGA
jgi:DUF1680 family protein